MSSNAAAGTAFPSPPGGFAPAPVQSTRRNMELLLLGFAVIITTVSLLLVEASQEQKITLDLAKYALAYTGLFLIAHLAIRRYAPYADPLLLPIVALLNGLGLVLIHRLDLADEQTALYNGVEAPSPDANQQVMWTALAITGFVLLLVFLKDYRLMARFSYTLGLAGLVFLAIPAILPAKFSSVNGAKIWIRLPGFSIQPGEFAKILLIIFFASVLVAKRDLFTSAGKHFPGHGFSACPRPRSDPARLDRLGGRARLRNRPRYVVAALQHRAGDALHRDRTCGLAGDRRRTARHRILLRLQDVRTRARARRHLAGPARRLRQHRLSDLAIAVRPGHRWYRRNRSGQRPPQPGAVREDGLHHRDHRRRARPDRPGPLC